MLELFIQSLTPDQQAALAGLLVSVLFWAGRYVFPLAFEKRDSIAKFQRTAASVVLCGLTVLTQTLAQGWRGPVAFLVTWALAYATAEGAHTVVSRTAAMK